LAQVGLPPACGVRMQPWLLACLASGLSPFVSAEVERTADAGTLKEARPVAPRHPDCALLAGCDEIAAEPVQVGRKPGPAAQDARASFVVLGSPESPTAETVVRNAADERPGPVLEAGDHLRVRPHGAKDGPKMVVEAEGMEAAPGMESPRSPSLPLNHVERARSTAEEVASLMSKPYLVGLLILGTIVLLTILCLSWGHEESSLQGVLTTVPHTPLELLAHREYQIVKTIGRATADASAKLLSSPLTSEQCLYSRTRVEHHTSSGWEPLLDFVECPRPFLLTPLNRTADSPDTQILCEVSTSAPAVLDASLRSAAFDGDLVQLPPPIQARLRDLPGPKLPAYSMFRVAEWTIREGQELVAMGLVIRRVSRKETKTALGTGGLSATNAEYISSLFSPIRIGRWRTVANRIVLGALTGEETTSDSQ